MRRTRGLLAGALIAGVASVTACQGRPLRFTNDERLTFEAPPARQRVTVPLTIRWRMKNFRSVGLDGSKAKDRGAFAVFLDREPIPVGKDMTWIARDDRVCKRDPRCPDEKYLADRGIFVTRKTSVVVETLPTPGRGAGDEHHYVHVVLLDGTGHRIDEAAWYRPFTSKGRSS